MLVHLIRYQKQQALFGVLLIGMSAFFSGCATSSAQSKAVWGRAEAKEIDINSKIAGRVVDLLVKEGDVVKKGQILARMDSREISAESKQAVAGEKALQAQLNQASANTTIKDQTSLSTVNVAKAHLAKAEANLDEAQSDYDRFAKLLAGNVVSEQTFKSYQTKYQVAVASKQEAEASVTEAEANVMQHQENIADEEALRSKIEQAAAAVDQTQVNLDETEIRAPFDGIITAKYVEVGAMISTGIPLVSIQDPNDNWINLKVPETDLAKYQVGTAVSMQGRDANLIVNGTIVDVSKKSEYATYRATSERDQKDIITFNVKIQVNSEKLRPGMQFHIAG